MDTAIVKRFTDRYKGSIKQDVKQLLKIAIKERLKRIEEYEKQKQHEIIKKMSPLISEIEIINSIMVADINDLFKEIYEEIEMQGAISVSGYQVVESTDDRPMPLKV